MESKLLELYVKKEYDKLLSEMISKKSDFDKNLFHYNLGTVFLKKGDYPLARYHFEKSKKAGFTGSELENNYNFLKNNLDVFYFSESHERSDRVKDFLYTGPFDFYLLISMILVLLFLLLRKVSVIKSNLVTIILILISFFPVLFFGTSVSSKNFAIALKDIPVREGASEIYEKTVSIKAGSKLILGKRSSDWFWVEAPKHLSGWIKRKDLGLF